MKTTLFPKKRAGNWSIILFISSIALWIAGHFIAIMQKNTIEFPNPINSPLLGTVIYLMFLTPIIASIIGLIAIIKKGERSILVYLSIPMGIILFIILLLGLIYNTIGLPFSS
jgi:hypothetical protein